MKSKIECLKQYEKSIQKDPKISDDFQIGPEGAYEHIELSDEEIKKGIKREWNYIHYERRHWMEEGAKWYREQLKNKKLCV